MSPSSTNTPSDARPFGVLWLWGLMTLCALWVGSALVAAEVEPWEVFETSFATSKRYANPYSDVDVSVVFQRGDRQWTVPAFWSGDGRWSVRFAPPAAGEYRYRVACTDESNPELSSTERSLRVTPYAGDHPLRRHGFLRVSEDRRRLEHADGTPFFWLGDTWWKNLCKRMTWDGFRELAADRKAKGFSLVQIVCGPYPDEGPFEARWENEGGKPYLARDLSVVNPAYFEYADRRIRHLVDCGLVPAIVGGWGRADCDGMKLAGVDGMKRHWRHLIARYGAYPVVWIIGGEAAGPEWTEVARYVQECDPYDHPVTMHPHQSGRGAVTDETVLDFDMLQTGHGDWSVAVGAIPKLKAAYSRSPSMPVVIGEFCYEGHMQSAFQDVERYVFWGSMLSGAAGLTYGAAGVWHASVEGDPGLANVYDLTTWREGMRYPGSTQLGLGKRLLEEYPWHRFEPHPEWVESGSFAAGIPGEVRVVYQPKRGVYDWTGPRVRRLEPGVAYRAFYFNPVDGKRYDQGTWVATGLPPKPFEGHSEPLLVSDSFDDGAHGAKWKDHGTPSQREAGHLGGGKGLVTILETVTDVDLMASVDARSDAEAGIILRFHDADHYLVALYSPLLRSIFLHDRKDGAWGDPLGAVDVPEIGPKIRLTAAACGEYAALVLTDGTRSYHTPPVKVTNVTRGRSGVWLYQIGERQEFDEFQLSRTKFAPARRHDTPRADIVVASDEVRAPRLPSPQDWVLVLERVASD